MRLSRREMLDHLHTLAHYVYAGRLPPFEHRTGETDTETVFTIVVDRQAYWRLMRKTQDIRDTIRRGSYAGVVLNDRPADLERYSSEVTNFLLDEHIVLGNMLIDREPMFIWTRGATTARNLPIQIRRYA